MTTDGASRLAEAARARRAAATDAATKNAARAMKAARRFSSPPDGVAGAPVTRVEHDATMTAQNLSQNL
ncbi:hypothetical protein SZ28_10500 [Burkholderia pseudomallei]|nr:hypothetical protein SZ28_10500 [Burkholderia pseudomallei]